MSGGSGCCKAKQRRQRTQKKFFDAYRAGQNYDINKARKLMRHLRRFPNHKQALDRLLAIDAIALRKAGIPDRGKYVASLSAMREAA